MKAFYAALILAALLGAGLRLYAISSQPPTADETGVAFTSDNYIERGRFGPTMPNHPHLRSIIVHWGMSAFGRGVYGLRGPSLLMGMLSIPLLGFLVLRITRNETASALAAFFLAVDPVHITFSRQAIQEVHTAFFFLAGTLLAVSAYAKADEAGAGKEERDKDMWMLPLAGVCFGLGLASKAHALFPMLVSFGFASWFGFKRHGTGAAAFSAASLLILPSAVFIATYIPWFKQGYGLSDWIFMQRALAEATANWKGNPMDSLIDIEAWQWFVRPFMGYGNFAYREGKPFVTMAMGNPLVWLAVIPAVIYAAIKRPPGALVLLALFLASYLPLCLASRPIWVLSSIAVTPFAYGLAGLSASRIADKAGRQFLWAYLGLVLAAGLLLYPMSIGKAYEYDYLRPLIERLNPHPEDGGARG